MSLRHWVTLFAMGCLIGCSTLEEKEETCSSIEGISHQGTQYRLEGVCLSTEDAKLSAVLGEDWHLSVWTGSRYIPIVSVVHEYRWHSPSKVELSFVTLSDDISFDIKAGYIGSS